MQRATIQWFDATSGEGVVVLDSTGESMLLHYTCIPGIAKNGYGWPTQDDQQRLRGIAGMPCLITVYENLYSRRVETCEVDV